MLTRCGGIGNHRIRQSPLNSPVTALLDPTFVTVDAINLHRYGVIASSLNVTNVVRVTTNRYASAIINALTGAFAHGGRSR